MTGPNDALQAMSIALHANVPVLLWGAPGTGKTSAVVAAGEAMAAVNEGPFPIEVVIASIREPADISGIPIVVDGTLRLAPPAWAERLASAGAGLLFFDEISTAAPAVQAALLRVCLDRVAGEVELGAGVRIIAAANPPEQAAGGWDLTPPLANRFCHLEWVTDATTVAAGLVGGFPRPAVPVLPAAELRPATIRARSLVGAFLQARPALHLCVPEDDASAGRGWPSPRSWEMASTLLAAAWVAGASPLVVQALLAGTVGAPAALELVSYLEHLDLPDPEAVLADPSSLTLPDRGDRALAVLCAVAGAAIANPSVERWQAAWEVVRVAVDAGAPDIAAVAAQALADHVPLGATTPAAAKALAPLLHAAGPRGCRHG